MEFLETNYEEFDDLSLNTLSDSYKNEYFMMETPRGIVYMSFDRDLQLFNYYSDKKELPNNYLDCVARNFVVNFDCKSIYIDVDEEIKKKYELRKLQHEKKINKNLNEKKIKNSDVFVKLKNSVLEERVKNIPLIPEKCNVFKYKGKILDYKNDIEKEKEKDKEIHEDTEYVNIDYKTFKNK